MTRQGLDTCIFTTKNLGKCSKRGGFKLSTLGTRPSLWKKRNGWSVQQEGIGTTSSGNSTTNLMALRNNKTSVRSKLQICKIFKLFSRWANTNTMVSLTGQIHLNAPSQNLETKQEFTSLLWKRGNRECNIYKIFRSFALNRKAVEGHSLSTTGLPLEKGLSTTWSWETDRS